MSTINTHPFTEAGVLSRLDETMLSYPYHGLAVQFKVSAAVMHKLLLEMAGAGKIGVRHIPPRTYFCSLAAPAYRAPIKAQIAEYKPEFPYLRTEITRQSALRSGMAWTVQDSMHRDAS
jgi:hypothetical protein